MISPITVATEFCQIETLVHKLVGMTDYQTDAEEIELTIKLMLDGVVGAMCTKDEEDENLICIR